MRYEDYIKMDSSFDEAYFKTRVVNTFVKYYTAVMLNELDNVKHFITEEVYNDAKNYIENCYTNGFRPMYEKVTVANQMIKGVEVLGASYCINVEVTSQCYKYKMSLEDNSIIDGDDKNMVKIRYDLKFIKKMGAKDLGEVRTCPHCGHNMDINNSGKCSYCGGIYDLDEYDWILSSIKEAPNVIYGYGDSIIE